MSSAPSMTKSFKREDFDKLLFQLLAAKPDTKSHDDAISEKVAAIEKMRLEAEKFVKRKTKYDSVMKIIKERESELELFKKSSESTIRALENAYNKKFEIFEEEILKILIENKDTELSDYIFRRFEEEFSVSRLELELKVRKLEDIEKSQQSTQTNEKEPRIIVPPTNGKVSFVNLAGDKPTKESYTGDYIVLATRVPIEIHGQKRDAIQRGPSRNFFGSNI